MPKQKSVEQPVDPSQPILQPSSLTPPVDDSVPAMLPPSVTGTTVPSVVTDALKGPEETPSLAPQGPKNPILKLFSRVAGQSADTPEPGQLYKGPTTGEEKRSNLGNYLSNLANHLSEAAAPFGTPEQKSYAMELPEKKRELQASNDLKNATLGVTNAYHQGQLQNAANKNDITQQNAQAAWRMKGYTVDADGSPRSMNEDEILADPILSRNRDIAGAAMNYKNAQTQLAKARYDALTNRDSETQKRAIEALEIKRKQAEGYLAMAQRRLTLAEGSQQISAYNAMMNTGQNPLTNETLGDAQDRGAAPPTFADNSGDPVPYKMQSAFIPTSSMRTQQQMAATIQPMVPKIQTEVKTLADKIGPVAGRWNDFWVNQKGIDDPDYAALDTDLSLFATALGKAHFGARIPEGFVNDMMHQFSQAQSPDDLLARLDHANDWVSGYAAFHAKQTPQPTHGGGGGGKVIEYEKGPDGHYRPKGSK